MEPENFVSSSHASSSLQAMRSMYKRQKLTDVTLVVSDVEITAHRLVLSSSSDYFRAMFTSNLIESTETRIPMKGMDPVALQALVDFCYSGEIELKQENVETILISSNILQMSEVMDACCEFLISRLHSSNSIGFSIFSKAHNCMKLYNAAVKYTRDNFTEVIHHPEFLALSVEELKNILSCDLINVPSEEDVYNSVMLWLKHDPINRQESIATIMEEIKLPLLSPQFIADKIATNPIFEGDISCHRLIVEALTYHLLPERRSSLHSRRTRPRKSTIGSMFMVGGMAGSKGSILIERYEPRTNTWSIFKTMTSRRLQFGAAVVDDKMFLAGGRDGLKTLNVVECLDFETQQWSAMPSMCTHRHGLGVAVLAGQVYAVGGHDGWTYLNSVERFDPRTRQWNYVAPLNTQRSTAAVAVLNDKLYVVGGRDGSSCLRSVECFDPHQNKWEYCAPMSTRRGGAGVGVLNGYLFALGGHDAPSSNPGVSRFDSVERFDPRTSTWTSVAPMSIGRDSVGVTVLGDRIMAVGGFDGQECLKIVEAYDPQFNQWEQVKSLEHGTAGMCVAVVKEY